MEKAFYIIVIVIMVILFIITAFGHLDREDEEEN